jgi:hypothetical protein
MGPAVLGAALLFAEGLKNTPHKIASTSLLKAIGYTKSSIFLTDKMDCRSEQGTSDCILLPPSIRSMSMIWQRISAIYGVRNVLTEFNGWVCVQTETKTTTI